MNQSDSIFKGKILIVDDNSANILLLEKILKLSGDFQLISTTDSRETIPLYLEHQPDLILLDVIMPYLNGFQVMEKLNEILGNDLLPIIIITAYNDQELRLKALQTGAKDFITKPFDFAEVLLRTRNMLEISNLNRKLKELQSK